MCVPFRAIWQASTAADDAFILNFKAKQTNKVLKVKLFRDNYLKFLVIVLRVLYYVNDSFESTVPRTADQGNFTKLEVLVEEKVGNKNQVAWDEKERDYLGQPF